MNYDKLFRDLEKLIPEVTEVLSKTKTTNLNISEIFKMFEKINRRLERIEKKIEKANKSLDKKVV